MDYIGILYGSYQVLGATMKPMLRRRPRQPKDQEGDRFEVLNRKGVLLSLKDQFQRFR